MARIARYLSSTSLILLGALVARAEIVAAGTPDPAASDDTIELDSLEVTAHPTGADERTAATWVLRPDVAPAPASIVPLLTAIPGLHVDRAGGAGGRSTLYLRGGEENHTLVLFDGVPLNDPTNSRGGGVDFSLLDAGVIGSAAVVRGPASMRHGPGAVSGVIHLDTISGATPGYLGTAEVGGQDLARATFRSVIASGHDGSSVTLGGAWHTEDADRDAGGLDRVFVHGGYRHLGRVDLTLRAWHLNQDSEAFPDDSGGVRYATVRELERRDDRHSGAALKLGRRDAAGAWQVTADAARLDARTVSPGVAPGERDPAGLPGTVDDIRFERLRLGGLVERHVADWIITTGVDAEHEKGVDEALLDFGFFQLPAGFRMDRDRVGGFIEGVGHATDAITVSAGLRADAFEGLGTHATGRLGLLASLRETTQLRANLGSTFKAPSFYALAHPLVGNSDLKPERGRSIDVGLRQTLSEGRALLDLSVFANELRNGVDFDPGPPPRLANLTEIHSRGAELSMLWHLSSTVDARSAVTYTDARSKPGDERMRSRPRWSGACGLSWSPVPALVLDAQWTALDGVPDTSIPTGEVMLPGWGRVDLAARFTVDAHWSVTVACDNALDQYYEEVVGFSAPGRRTRISLQVLF